MTFPVPAPSSVTQIVGTLATMRDGARTFTVTLVRVGARDLLEFRSTDRDGRQHFSRASAEFAPAIAAALAAFSGE